MLMHQTKLEISSVSQQAECKGLWWN